VNDQLGPELSAAARQLIADARGADEPSAEDEARVKARWLAGIAAGAGVSSLSEAVRAAASTGWGLKVGALAAAFAAATAGVLLGWPQTSGQDATSTPAPQARAPVPVTESAPAPEQAAPPPAPVVAPRVAQPAPVVAAPEAEKPAEEASPSAAEAPVQQPEAVAPQAAIPQIQRPGEAHLTGNRATPPRSAASSRRAALERAEKPQDKAVAPAAEEPAAPASSGQLGEEIAALSQIRIDLQAGAAPRALEQLNEYRRRFGQPSLAMEADALRVDALCRAGQRDAARAAAAAFASDWPNSPLQQRVSAACP
jgi:hypothetical protein